VTVLMETGRGGPRSPPEDFSQGMRTGGHTESPQTGLWGPRAHERGYLQSQLSYKGVHLAAGVSGNKKRERKGGEYTEKIYQDGKEITSRRKTPRSGV